jgi:hypothetical protein
MYKFRKATKDASIYLQTPNQNTGIDSILEVGKYIYLDSFNIVRSVLHFDLSTVTESISSADLILKSDQSEELSLNYTLYSYPISGSWEMGIGTYNDGVSTYGVSWNYRDGNSQTLWISGSIGNDVDASYSNGIGGIWYPEYESTYSFLYQSSDTQFNVINTVRAWLSGSIQNNGFIIKHSTDADTNETDYGIIQFFSKETHTIYPPKLRLGVDDFTYTTGSMPSLSSVEQLMVVPKLGSEYKVNSINRILISGRELYPTKRYSTYVSHKYSALPPTSYYEIRDYVTDEIIIPYSEYSKISTDYRIGSYINVDFTDWEINRDYVINFKIERNGLVEYFSNNYRFRVAN